MTLFGIIWLVVLMFCFRKTKDLALLTIISSTLQCSNVIQIGDFGLGPQIITSFAFVVRMIIESKHKGTLYKKPISTIFLIMFMLFAFLIFTSIKNNEIGNCSLKLIQLLTYILTVYFMLNIGKKMSNDQIYRFVRKLTISLLAIGFVQFGITSGVLPRISIVGTLLYNDPNTDVVYYNTDNWLRFTSTYMEPSYYSGFLDGAFFYFLADKENRKKNYLLLVMIFFQIIFTFSSTAYGVFAICGIVFFLFSKELKFKYKLLLFAAVGFVIFYLVFPDTLNYVIFKKFSGQSYAGRGPRIILAMEMFRLSPIIGNGYKTMRASSIIETMLAETGIIGFSIYLLLAIHFIYILKNNKHKKYVFMAGLTVLSAMIAQIIAVPDLDICTFWMWMNVFALHYSSDSRRMILQQNENTINHNNLNIRDSI